MATAFSDTLYALRSPFPDTIVPGEVTILQARFVRNGTQLIPTDCAFELLDSSGTDVFPTASVTVDAAGTCTVIVDASDSADWEIGELYQSRWQPGGVSDPTQPWFRREAVVAPFKLWPPVGQDDLIDGNYPDLLEQLGSYDSHVQPYIDDAWGWFLRRLFKVGRWPDLLVSTHDAFDVVRERSWFLIFRFLFRRAGGRDNRFEKLMEDHREGFKSEWAAFSGRWDNDGDGLAESVERDAVGPIHSNAAPRRRLRRDSRW